MIALFIDFEWNRKILKFLKDEEISKIVLAIDHRLLRLSAEIIAEKGWLGEHEIDSLVRALERQLDKKRKKFLENLKEKFPDIDVESSDKNLRDLLKKLTNEGKKIVVFARKKSPIWGIVKPVLNELKGKKAEITVLNL